MTRTDVEVAVAPSCSAQKNTFSSFASAGNDPNWSELQRTAKISKEKSAAWLGQRQYYGDLASNKVFSNAFSHWLQEIWHSGVESAIDAYLQ